VIDDTIPQEDMSAVGWIQNMTVDLPDAAI
jgi:hypothetical protein